MGYQDDRSFSITLSSSSATNQSLTVDEGSTVHQVPVGINILSLQSAANVNYSINLASISGATVTWPSPLPQFMSTANVNGVFTAYNIYSKTGWDFIKNPIVTLPRDRSGSFVYTANLSYPTNQSKQWNINLTVNDLPELSTTTNIAYDKDFAVTLSGTPQIVDFEPDGIFTMVVASNVTSAVGSMSVTNAGGASASFNSTAKSLTIQGYRNQVNTALNSILFTPNAGFASNFALSYTLTNPVSSLVTVKNQIMTNANLYPDMTNITSPRYYLGNTPALLFPNLIPRLTSTTNTTYRVELTLGSDIGFIGSGNTKAFTPNWYDGNLTYVVAGTYTSVNSQLAALYYVPNRDITTTTTLKFAQYENDFIQGNSVVNLIGAAGATISNTPTVYTFYGEHQNSALTIQSFTPTNQQIFYNNFDILVVGPGGGGGTNIYWQTRGENSDAGAGGAGGVVYETQSNVFAYLNTTYGILVGVRGLSSPVSYGSSDTIIYKGTTNSSPVLRRAIKGGYGGTGFDFPTYLNGNTGGSGGGASIGGGYGSGTPGQGYDGGQNSAWQGKPKVVAGGGGGAGGPAPLLPLGQGGPGFFSNISGVNVEYARGGGLTIPGVFKPIPTTYGSGGCSGGKAVDGIVIIKVY